MTNYTSLEKWFNQKVANANKQMAGHKAQASSRDATEQARQKTQAEEIATREQAEAKMQTDNQAREAGRLAKVKARQQAAALAEEHAKSRVAAKNSPDAVAHREFSKAYQNVRVALQFLDPSELAKPVEANHWRKKLKKFEGITAKFSDRENPDVKKDLALYAKMKEKIESGLTASEKLGISNYPDYQKDLETIGALSKKYNVSNVFTKGKELKAKQLNDAYGNDKKTYDTLFARYKPLMDGNTAAYQAAYKEANTLRRGFRYLGERLSGFAKSQDQFSSGIAPKINGHLKDIEGMIASAYEKNDPQFFTGGIQQRAKWAEDSLLVYKTVAGDNDAGYKETQRRFDSVKVEIKKSEVRLIEKIIVARKTPDDKYRGTDKNKLIQMLVDDLKKSFPGQNVLATGIEDSQWARTAEWNAYGSGGLYKTDYSRVHAWVITKKDSRLATLYWTSISKNHMKGDELLVFGYRDDYQGSDMLLSNVQR
ncbi:MAG: hypothetical protein R8M38_06330 [Mariprofundaceae bacterium]